MLLFAIGRSHQVLLLQSFTCACAGIGFHRYRAGILLNHIFILFWVVLVSEGFFYRSCLLVANI